MRARALMPRLAAALALCALAARGEEQAVYGPDGAPTVVQRKLHPMAGLWEAGVAFDMAVNTALVDQMGGVAEVSYHANEWLDLGAEGFLHHTALSALAQNVRAGLRSRTPGQRRDEMSGDNQLRAGALGVLRLAPVYGKFNLAGEADVHFQAYLVGGGGVASIHRESVNLCADPGTGSCRSFEQSDATRPLGLLGGGLRFYFNRALSLRTEVRGYLFRSSYTTSADLTQPGSGGSRGYLATVATFNAGVSFLF
ncbi:MAG TPA: outer membrane beta-barrel domain-containing protein [Myxococcales bacterium]|nr:outer membrane beta-barrel domain-containing protein [Myxococcales bacterium]